MTGKIRFVFAGLIAATFTSAASAAPYRFFTDVSFFGQANTTYQEWEGFSAPAGPNPPTKSTTVEVPTWVDRNAAADQAFLIGNPPSSPTSEGGHIYSFGGMVNFSEIIKPEIVVPATVLAGGFTNITLQTETQGTGLDLTSFTVTPLGGSAIAASSVSEVNEGAANGGGFDFVYTVQFNALPSVSSYTMDFLAAGTSASQIATRVDTVTAVPEPMSLGLIALGSVLGLRRRNK